MKTTKFLGITVGILAVVLAGVLIGGGAYLKGEYNRTTYYGRTLINGRDVSNETPEQVFEDIMRTCRTRTVVKGRGEHHRRSFSFRLRCG